MEKQELTAPLDATSILLEMKRSFLRQHDNTTTHFLPRFDICVSAYLRICVAAARPKFLLSLVFAQRTQRFDNASFRHNKWTFLIFCYSIFLFFCVYAC